MTSRFVIASDRRERGDPVRVLAADRRDPVTESPAPLAQWISARMQAKTL